MAEFELTAEAPLDGAKLELDGIALQEVSGRSLVSIAIPYDGGAALRSAVEAAYGLQIPATGRFVSRDGTFLLGMARDQIWLMRESSDADAATRVAADLGGAGYVTDQSDAWVLVRVSGRNCRAALERICPLDLDADVFTAGTVARTVMEHLSVIILREQADAFLLMSPRSSAQSFWHALEVSARNVS